MSLRGFGSLDVRDVEGSSKRFVWRSDFAGIVEEWWRGLRPRVRRGGVRGGQQMAKSGTALRPVVVQRPFLELQPKKLRRTPLLVRVGNRKLWVHHQLLATVPIATLACGHAGKCDKRRVSALYSYSLILHDHPSSCLQPVIALTNSSHLHLQSLAGQI